MTHAGAAGADAISMLAGAGVVWRDEELLVLDKPSGLSVLADRNGPCLWDALRDAGLKPLSVHRIDKGTSGLLLIALTPALQRSLSAAFEARTLGKWYTARLATPLPLVAGIDASTLTIDLPITPGRKNRQRIAGPREAMIREETTRGIRYRLPEEARFVDRPGRDALTRVRALATDPTLVCVAPHTGRTHQIRLHLGWIGHPLVGDALYAGPGRGAIAETRLGLHCHRLVLPPMGNRPRTFTAPLPDDFPEPPRP